MKNNSEKLNLFSKIRAPCFALSALLMVAACGSKIEKANSYEAAYDGQMNRNAYREALASISKAVRNDENEPRRWLKLAKVQDMLNRPTAAAVSYQRALDLDPSNIEALENLAVLSVRGAQYDMAQRYIEPLLLLAPNDLPGLLAAGSVAMHRRRFADAEKIAAQITAAAPMLEEGHILRARVLALTGRPGEAIRLLEERQKIDPDNRDLPRELLNMYRQQGDRAGIRRTAIRLYEKFPDNPSFALESVRAYNAMGREGEARAIMDMLVRTYPSDISVMSAVAGLWRDMEPRDVAVSQITAMALKAPPHVRAALADMLTSIGEPARAATILAFVAQQPVSARNIDFVASYARTLYALGRTRELQGKVDALLAFDATNPVGLLLRARLALARGDYAKAATDAGVVVSDDDTNEEAALLLASIYAAQGNSLLAAKAFGEARGNFPGSARVVDAQTKWLLGQKRTDEAVRIAAAYAHAHPRQIEAWQIYRNVCMTAPSGMCGAEAQRGLESFS